jgi:hypothetical protein
MAMGLAMALAPFTALAQQPPPVDPQLYKYLAETPVTLLEWGMLRLGRDVQGAVAALSLDGGRNGGAKVKTGTLFRPFDRRVVAYVSLPVAGKARNLDQCQEIYGLLRESLLAGAPGGLSGPPWYLQRLFGADTRSGRPEPFGEMLVEMVLLEVTLRVPEAENFTPGSKNIICAGKLDQEQAAEVQPWRPPPP